MILPIIICVNIIISVNVLILLMSLILIIQHHLASLSWTEATRSPWCDLQG